MPLDSICMFFVAVQTINRKISLLAVIKPGGNTPSETLSLSWEVEMKVRWIQKFQRLGDTAQKKITECHKDV